MRIAVTHNCEWRNSGTATFALRALKELEAEGKLEKVQHFQPRGDIPGEWDAYIYVDDGRDDLRWIPPHPWAYWAVDTHLGYGYRVWKAGLADRVFTAQKDAVDKFKKDGIKHVSWLPLACCPEAHPCKEELLSRVRPTEQLDKQFDFAFVGFMQDSREAGHNNRVDYLDALFKAFPNSWLSTGTFFEDMAIRYIKARVGFNISIANDLNMRVFEVMSFGVPLLTNRNVEGLSDLFGENFDFVGYEGQDEMIEQSKKCVNQWDLGPNARRAFNKVREKHTYKHRMEVIVEELKHV